jgi:acetyl esterase/lipase
MSRIIASLSIAVLCILPISAFSQNDGTRVVKMMLKKFEILDRDKSGTLTYKELELVKARVPQEKHAALDVLLKKMDQNSDLEISKMEMSEFTGIQTKNSANVARPSTGKHLDVRYGDHERNTLDLWLAKSDKPTALVIYIHGGGFKAGDKSKGQHYKDDFLKAGISFASLNYRFLKHSKNGVFGCLNDSKRALQFLSSKAKEWNFNRDKFALVGGSAGAGTSLWLGYKDDMADPHSADPVLRESTRVRAVAVLSTQCTYDFSYWYPLMNIDLTNFDKGAVEGFYGLQRGELDSVKGEAVIKDLDLLSHLDKGDPPLYANNPMKGGQVKEGDKGHINHHPLHVKALKDKAKSVGLRHQCHARAIGIDDNPKDNKLTTFLIRELK